MSQIIEQINEKAYELGRMEHEICEDCINRHEAIIQLSHNKTGDDDVDVVVRKDIETIKALPPVAPQPKMGRWIRVDKDKLKCSECEVIHLIAQYPNGKIDWRPTCGSYNGGNNNVNE